MTTVVRLTGLRMGEGQKRFKDHIDFVVHHETPYGDNVNIQSFIDRINERLHQLRFIHIYSIECKKGEYDDYKENDESQ